MGRIKHEKVRGRLQRHVRFEFHLCADQLELAEPRRALVLGK